MGRPSLAGERIATILDAYERCIVEHGYDGASLERIASVADMRLSMIRHYIGNRDALLQAMVERFSTRYIQGVEQLSLNKSESGLDPFLRYLLLEDDVERQNEEAIFSELIAVAEREEAVKTQVLAVYKSVEKHFIQCLKQQYQGRTTAQYNEAAYAVLCLAEASGTRQWLGYSPKLRKSSYLIAKQVLESHLSTS